MNSILQFAIFALMIASIACLLWYYYGQRKLNSALKKQNQELQDRLNEQLNCYEFALDSGNVGMYQWDVKTNKLLWNKHHFLIFGFSPDETEATYTAFRSRVHPDDIEPLEHKLEHAKITRTDYENDFRILLPNNEIRHIKGHGRWRYDDQGEAISMLGVIIDNTEAYQKQQALDENQKQHRTLLENVPAVIARMDLAQRHLYVNDRIREITGIAPENFIGKTNEDMGMPPELCEEWRKESLLVIDTKRSRKIPFSFESAEQKTLYFEAHIVPELDADGNVETLLFITHEVTDLMESKKIVENKELELRAANLRKNEFLMSLAHELRNIASPLINGIELMKIKAAGKPEDLHINQIMQRQIDIINRMTNDLLDTAKIAQGKTNLVKSYESLRTILETAIDMATPALKARNHNFTAQLPSEALLIHGDSVRLTQVFVNIINNAIKYTPENGVISIEANTADSTVCVLVKDNGIGIPQDKVMHIFELFEQGGQTEGNQFNGMGIGLAVVKSLVEQHNGHIEVESSGHGTGSTFKVHLPLENTLELH